MNQIRSLFLQAIPLDFGESGVARLPQVRYTLPLTRWLLPGALSVSAETPETDAVTAGGLIASDGSPISINPAAPFFNPLKSPAPDLTAAWYIPQPCGHTDFAVVLRPALQFKDGLFVDRTFTGYGVHVSGDVKPGWFGWRKDDVLGGVTYGDAIGRYLNSSANFALVSNYPAVAPPASAAAAANVIVKPTIEWGAFVGYQHWWRDNLRSNISAGINHHDINSALLTPALLVSLNKELMTMHVNLFWNPVPFVDIGIEYIWAHRIVVANLKGDENAVIGKFGVRF